MNQLGERHPTPKQLAYRLQQFAFSQSPQFKSGELANVNISQVFDLSFDVRPDVDHDTEDITDRMRLTLGFQAMRATGVGDYYHFSTNCRASRPVDPSELRLSADDWLEVGSEYGIEPDEAAGPAELPGLVQTKINHSGAYCTQYLENDYSIATSDHQLRLSEEHGYTVGDDKYGVAEREDFYETDGIGYTESIVLPPIADQPQVTIDDFMRFNALVADMRHNAEQTGDVMSYVDKQREMMFIVNCLRKRTIPL